MEKVLRDARRVLVSLVLAYVEAILHSDEPRKGRCLGRKMELALNRHLRHQNKIFRIVLRERLEARPAMRAQVCADLGGKVAMVRWERRRRAGGRLSGNVNDGLESVEFRELDKDGKRKPPQKRWTPKTDRYGCFRMARIADGTVKARRKPVRATTRKVAYESSAALKAVEVTSEDLRQNRHCYDEFYHPPKYVGRPPKGHGPPIDRWPI